MVYMFAMIYLLSNSFEAEKLNEPFGGKKSLYGQIITTTRPKRGGQSTVT